MRLRLTDFGVLAIIVTVGTAWLLLARSRIAPESNWPLFFYLGLVVYVKSVGTFVEPGVVYAAVICAMLIRFEFMSSKVIVFFRFVESACLVWVIYRCLDFILL